MPPEILRLSDKYLNNPKNILIDSDDLSGEGIDQSFLVIKDREKHKYLTDFINQNRGQVIVLYFVQQKLEQEMLHEIYKNPDTKWLQLKETCHKINVNTP